MNVMGGSGEPSYWTAKHLNCACDHAAGVPCTCNIAESCYSDVVILTNKQQPGLKLDERIELQAKIIITAALLVAIRLTLPGIGSGLWLDETGTAWVISGGFGDILHRAVVFPQSLLFMWMEWAITRPLGFTETTLRIIPLIAFSLTLWRLYRLAGRIFGAVAAGFTLVVFLSIPRVVYEAIDARPYALALLFVVLSTERLLDVEEAPGFRNCLLYALCAAMIAYFSYFYALVIGGHFLYLIYRRVPAKLIILSYGIIGVLTAPLIPLAIASARGGGIHILGEVARIAGITQAFLPALAGTIAVLGLLMASASERTTPSIRVDTPRVVLLVASIAVPVFVLAALSRFTGFKMYTERYLLCAAPASAMLTAKIIEAIRPAWIRLSCALLIALLTLTSLGPRKSLSFRHDPAGWREALTFLKGDHMNRIDGINDIPIAISSGYIEATQMPLPASDFDQTWLLSEVSFYPIDRPVEMLPFRVTAHNSTYVQSVSNRLANTGRFAVLLADGDPVYEWLRLRCMEDFHTRTVYTNGYLSLIEFTARPETVSALRQVE